jgi:hypothetical protein
MTRSTISGSACFSSDSRKPSGHTAPLAVSGGAEPTLPAETATKKKTKALRACMSDLGSMGLG